MKKIFLIFILISFSSAQAGNLSTILGTGGSGSSTCDNNVSGTTYFIVGGNPFYCKQKAISANGYSQITPLNDGFRCDTSKVCSSGSCTVGTSTKRRIFITAQKWTATNVGGVSGADAKCQAAADAVGLGNTWKAYLSTSVRNANTVTTTASAYYRAINSAALVLVSGSDFSTSALNNYPGFDETGAVGVGYYWHGSDTNGANDAANNCTDFSAAGGVGKVELYSATSIGGVTTIACTSSNSLLCVEQ